MIHLSETGLHSGRRLCLAPRDETSRSVHAVYAPLYKEEFREQVCAACLKIWADEAFEDGDVMPDYIAQIREKPSNVSSAHVNHAARVTGPTQEHHHG